MSPTLPAATLSALMLTATLAVPAAGQGSAADPARAGEEGIHVYRDRDDQAAGQQVRVLPAYQMLGQPLHTRDGSQVGRVRALTVGLDGAVGDVLVHPANGPLDTLLAIPWSAGGVALDDKGIWRTATSPELVAKARRARADDLAALAGPAPLLVVMAGAAGMPATVSVARDGRLHPATVVDAQGQAAGAVARVMLDPDRGRAAYLLVGDDQAGPVSPGNPAGAGGTSLGELRARALPPGALAAARGDGGLVQRAAGPAETGFDPIARGGRVPAGALADLYRGFGLDPYPPPG